MNRYANALKDKLLSLIAKLAQSPERFVRNPDTDFKRNRKLPFEIVMQLLIAMGGKSIYRELVAAQGYDSETATASAFTQQRGKILPCAFEALLHSFNRSYANIKKYRNYRLLAGDGSCLPIAPDCDGSDTHIPNGVSRKGFHALHLNALYDLCNKLYIDVLIQPARKVHEKRALVDMVDRCDIEENVIVIADRNFENYNTFAHIEKKGWNYLIRIKDLGSTGILSGLPLPQDGEFDLCFERIITRKKTNAVKAQPLVYRCLTSTSAFDFVDYENPYYTMSFRVVRIQIDEGFYETLITNLDSAAFPPAELKQLYHLRWGIETSFRKLKYAIGLTCFHSKKREHIAQEVFARVILYNFTEMIASHAVISKSDKKHTYQVNFTVASDICRQFLRLWRNAPPLNVEALIHRNILPVRPCRKHKRNVRDKGFTSFVYRVA